MGAVVLSNFPNVEGGVNAYVWYIPDICYMDHMRCMCKDFQPCVMSSRSTAKNLFYDSFLSIRCKVKQYVRAVCDFTQCVSYYTQTQYAIVHKFVNCKYNLRYFGAKLSLSHFGPNGAPVKHMTNTRYGI